jgi:citrate lyase beta subunit
MKPRRSTLSVPGHIEKMHRKAAASAADVIMLDLEDSVPVDLKERARRQVIDSLRAVGWGEKTVTVRINSVDSPFGYRDLLEVSEAAGDRIDAVVVPKVNHPGDVYFVSRFLDGVQHSRGFARSTGIEVSIETAQGLGRVREIARCSRRIQTLVFGIVDYQVSIGARLVSISGHGENDEQVYPGHRWHFAMSRLVMAAKACDLLAIDAPYGHFQDLKGLQRSSSLAAALGFDGKWAIHPDQIAAINAQFTPSDEDVSRAETILAAHRTAEADGFGAVCVDGRMVDEATVRLARRTLEMAGRRMDG